MNIERKTADILHRLTIGMIDKFDAKTEILNLFSVSQNTDNAYKKCAECGKMKMVGVQCKDPRTGQCDKDPRYIKDFIAPIVSQQRELLIAYENKVGHMDKDEAIKFVDEYLSDKGN